MENQNQPIVNTQIQENSQKKFSKQTVVSFFTKHFSIIRKYLFWGFVFLKIYMFIALLMPVSAAHSQVQYIGQTAFYSVKYGTGGISFLDYSVSLTPAGIILVVLLAIQLIMFGLTIFYNWTTIKKEIKEGIENNKKTFYFKKVMIHGLLLTIFLLLLIFILIPPNFSAVANYYFANTILEGTIEHNKDSIIQSLGIFGIAQIIGPDGSLIDIASAETGMLYSALLAKVANQSSFNFLFYANFSGGIATQSNGIYGIIVPFSVLLGLSLLTLLSNYVFKFNLKIKSIFNKERYALIKAKMQERAQEKKQMQLAKKEMINRENELLKDLNAVNIDKITAEQQKGIISQEELESKIAQNNEIKKQLDELIKQKIEINKEAEKNSKWKSMFKKQPQDLSNNRNKKQTITVPDKELDEIFKNLEID